MSKIVPSIPFSLEKDGYRCNTCLTKIIVNRWNVGEDSNSNFIKWGAEKLICPVCNSLEKDPTKKMSEEDMQKKKEEIRDRLIDKAMWKPEPTEQMCQVCGNVYVGGRAKLCEDLRCRKWLFDERQRNQYKYGPVSSTPNGAVFYQDYAAEYREPDIEEDKIKESWLDKIAELGKKLAGK